MNQSLIFSSFRWFFFWAVKYFLHRNKLLNYQTFYCVAQCFYFFSSRFQWFSLSIYEENICFSVDKYSIALNVLEAQKNKLLFILCHIVPLILLLKLNRNYYCSLPILSLYFSLYLSLSTSLSHTLTHTSNRERERERELYLDRFILIIIIIIITSFHPIDGCRSPPDSSSLLLLSSN